MAKQSLMEAGLNKKLANMVVRREDYTRLEDNILGRHNLNCKAGPAECSAAEIGEKFSGIAPDTQTFFTLDMHQEEGAHVIGLVGSRDGGWCLMDPNRGEFQIDCQNLADAQERVDALTMFVYTFLSTFKFTKFFFRAFR